MKYIAYCRISTNHQLKTGSLEDQKRRCEEYVAQKGLTLHKCFNDAGLSGILPIHRRPGLRAAIEEIDRGDVLIVSYRDRLARDTDVMEEIKRQIRLKKGKIISCAGEGTESDDEYDLASAIAYYASDFLAKMEQVLTKVRVKQTMVEKKARGERVGQIPYGKKLSSDGIHLEDCEEEIKTINEALRLRGTGLTLASVANTLNSNNMRNRGDKPWNIKTTHLLCAKFQHLICQHQVVGEK